MTPAVFCYPLPDPAIQKITPDRAADRTDCQPYPAHTSAPSDLDSQRSPVPLVLRGHRSQVRTLFPLEYAALRRPVPDPHVRQSPIIAAHRTEAITNTTGPIPQRQPHIVKTPPQNVHIKSAFLSPPVRDISNNPACLTNVRSALATDRGSYAEIRADLRDLRRSAFASVVTHRHQRLEKENRWWAVVQAARRGLGISDDKTKVNLFLTLLLPYTGYMM